MVRGDQLGVGRGFPFGFYDRPRPLPEEFGSAGAAHRSDPIQFRYEIVIELDEHFTSGHDHMLKHMVSRHTRFRVDLVGGSLPARH